MTCFVQSQFVHSYCLFTPLLSPKDRNVDQLVLQITVTGLNARVVQHQALELDF